MARLREWASRLAGYTVALWYCARHPRTPLAARLLAAAVAAYALSPIDLIPDFIPLLGYLDDLILLQAGIWLVPRLVPADVMAECRGRAARRMENGMPRGYAAATIIVALWLAALAAGWLWLSD